MSPDRNGVQQLVWEATGQPVEPYVDDIVAEDWVLRGREWDAFVDSHGYLHAPMAPLGNHPQMTRVRVRELTS